jgi:phosphomannomutase
VLLLELMSKKGQALAELLAPLKAKYFISGEINTKVASMDVVKKKLDGLTAKYSDATVAHIDGVSVDYTDWHFNVRPSNTEPLLRLNLEATTPEKMAQKRDEVLGFIRG